MDNIRRSEIAEEGSLQKYFASIPHTVVRGRYSFGLSVYAKWLYVYLKSRTGQNGQCTCSTTTMAQEAGMSRGQVSAAKQELVKHRLIVIHPGKNPRRHSDVIRIKDIWLANFQEFTVHNTNTDENEEDTLYQLDNNISVHNTNTKTPVTESSVHDMNSLHETQPPGKYEDTTNSVQDMNTQTDSVFTIRTLPENQCSQYELGVHNMNQRKTIEEKPEELTTSSSGSARFADPAGEVGQGEGATLPDAKPKKATKPVITPLPAEDWVWRELQNYTVEFDVEALNDNDWWSNLANSFPVFNATWVPQALAELASWLTDNPQRRPRNGRGWKQRMRYSLNRFYDKHTRRQAYGQAAKQRSRY